MEVTMLQAESRAASSLHDWGRICADLGIRTVSVASAALQLDWSLTAMPSAAGGARAKGGSSTAGNAYIRKKQS